MNANALSSFGGYLSPCSMLSFAQAAGAPTVVDGIRTGMIGWTAADHFLGAVSEAASKGPSEDRKLDALKKKIDGRKGRRASGKMPSKAQIDRVEKQILPPLLTMEAKIASMLKGANALPKPKTHSRTPYLCEPYRGGVRRFLRKTDVETLVMGVNAGVILEKAAILAFSEIGRAIEPYCKGNSGLAADFRTLRAQINDVTDLPFMHAVTMIQGVAEFIGDRSELIQFALDGKLRSKGNKAIGIPRDVVRNMTMAEKLEPKVLVGDGVVGRSYNDPAKSTIRLSNGLSVSVERCFDGMLSVLVCKPKHDKAREYRGASPVFEDQLSRTDIMGDIEGRHLPIVIVDGVTRELKNSGSEYAYKTMRFSRRHMPTVVVVDPDGTRHAFLAQPPLSSRAKEKEQDFAPFASMPDQVLPAESREEARPILLSRGWVSGWNNQSSTRRLELSTGYTIGVSSAFDGQLTVTVASSPLNREGPADRLFPPIVFVGDERIIFKSDGEGVEQTEPDKMYNGQMVWRHSRKLKRGQEPHVSVEDPAAGWYKFSTLFRERKGA